MDPADGELYRKHADELTRFATGLVGPTHAADVVSEAVLRCMSSEPWAGVVEKRAYLFRSVYNEAARLHRSTGRRRAREQQVALPESVEQPDIRPEVLSAVARLSLRQRAVIVLTYWDDFRPRSHRQSSRHQRRRRPPSPSTGQIPSEGGSRCRLLTSSTPVSEHWSPS